MKLIDHIGESMIKKRMYEQIHSKFIEADFLKSKILTDDGVFFFLLLLLLLLFFCLFFLAFFLLSFLSYSKKIKIK